MNLEELKAQFIKVLEHSQNIDKLNVDQLFDSWYKNKLQYINHFDGKLIYETAQEYQFELTPADKKSLFPNFMAWLDNYLGNCAESRANIEDIYRLFWAHPNNLFDNRLDEDYKTTKNITIPKGTKLLKSLKFITDNKKIIDDIQTKASEIVQKNKLKGKLCLSVHPLDYLSLSENTHKWRSCHALDGSYRAGNLSYMIDKSTVIAYIKSDGEYKLPHFPVDVPWNSKKWRMLLHFSTVEHTHGKYYMFFGRQYPFEITRAKNKVAQLINRLKIMDGYSLSPEMKVVEEINNYTLYEPYVLRGGKSLIPITEAVIPVAFSLNYNDVLYSTARYTPSYIIDLKYWGFLDKVEVGAPVRCLRCGTKNIKHPEQILCDDCAEKREEELNGKRSNSEGKSD